MAMAKNHPSGARPKQPIQRPLTAYRMSEDERLARKLYEEEESLALDELMAQQLQEQINVSDHEKANELQEEFSRYQGMTMVDGMLARQLQLQEEKTKQKKRPPRRPESDFEDDLGMLPGIVSAMSGHQPMGGNPPSGRPRRQLIMIGGHRRLANAENLPNGESDPEQLLMTNSPQDFLGFLNMMRDPRLLFAMMAPQFEHLNEENVDLNDYDSMWELAERLGEVKHKGLTNEGISALPTRQYQLNGPQNTDCQICLAKFETGEELRILPCTHEYHTACIDEWLKRNATCPVCRNNISTS
ncbi:uncharacterized protein LOC121382986 isoform X2 [Gigantopelta aegis]|uniref:uncharacterized protein LOC121382986 isoform X2 n=1 Tax=Gigantopelta aegis TaxID=1735272 RepID=UPI001B88844E|nr:uncharacterized protein LOC121382986 isoform X2 [Gigantopelta aegis]